MALRLYELSGIDFSIHEIVAMNQYWEDGLTFNMLNPRPSDAFLLLYSGYVDFIDNNTGFKQTFPLGSIIYIPRNSVYSWTFHKLKDSIPTKLIEFKLKDNLGNDLMLSDSIKEINQPYPMAYEHYFDYIIKEYLKPVYSHPKVKSILYELLSNLSENSRDDIYTGAPIIYKGIRYLEDDPLQKKSIKEIADMCNISENYFETLFKEYAGCTPTQYRINKKVERAKVLLNTKTSSIKQVALALGYTDCAYFCKIFKKVTGYTPSEFKKGM